MGFVVTIGIALLLVLALGIYLRRRGNTSASWDGRQPGQQKRRDSGPFGGGGY
jgi:hypothetical protein